MHGWVFAVEQAEAAGERIMKKLERGEFVDVAAELEMHEPLEGLVKMRFGRFKELYKGPQKACADVYQVWCRIVDVFDQRPGRIKLKVAEEARERTEFERHNYDKDGPGYIYFFRTVTGWYKFGRTENWRRRIDKYIGPQRPAHIYLLRPVPKMMRAETQLKEFLLGGSRFYLADGNEWLTKTGTQADKIYSQQLRANGGVPPIRYFQEFKRKRLCLRKKRKRKITVRTRAARRRRKNPPPPEGPTDSKAAAPPPTPKRTVSDPPLESS